MNLLTRLAAFFLLPALCLAEPIKIGVLAPLSGDVAAWGVDTQRALSLSNEILGKGKFELVFEDDRCLGKNAVTGANKLLSLDKVQYGMIVCTEPTLSAAPIFERAKVVVVAPGATGAAVSHAGDYIFRTWPSDDKLVRTLFSYAQKHFKKVAVISELRGFPQEFSRVFVGLAQQSSLPIVSEDFNSAESDFRPLLLKLKAGNPDALLISTDSDRTLLQIVKQLNVMNWKVPLLSQYIAGTPSFYEKAGHLADGLIYGDAPEVNCADNLRGCEVLREFERRYGKAQSSPFMIASAVASFLAITDAAQSGREPREYLYDSKVNTPLGELSFDKQGDVIGPVHALKILEKGVPAAFEGK